MMTPSCTAALEMAAILCGLQPGDEVILPSFTFVSTANAVVRLGARPIFVDIRPDTLNLDDSLIEDAITEHTRAIFPVHYAGVACEMERILTIGQKYRLHVVEDAAQGVNSWYNGRAVGSLGCMGTFSFHETKNYICGEGGALCINSPEFVERAEIIRDKGTNRRQFFRGEVDKYTWVDIGSSYVPSEICGAFLYAQLELLDEIAEKRHHIYAYYQERLAPLEAQGLVRLPHVPENCRSNYHMFYLLLPSRRLRDGLLAYLNKNGVNAVFHYIPLHSSPMGEKFGYQAEDLPVTEQVSGSLVRLPFHHELTTDEQDLVVQHVTQYLLQADTEAKTKRADDSARSILEVVSPG
jgi:dTDP-4-amino-4,6-dideoxygalactose transaminase